MLINILTNHWIICKGRDPLLWTASIHEEVAKRKWENRERKKWSDNNGYKCVNVDITVKDLNPE